MGDACMVSCGLPYEFDTKPTPGLGMHANQVRWLPLVVACGVDNDQQSRVLCLPSARPTNQPARELNTREAMGQGSP